MDKEYNAQGWCLMYEPHVFKFLANDIEWSYMIDFKKIIFT